MEQDRSSSTARPTEDFTHRALDIADTLALAYLVHMDATDPVQLCAYAKQREERVGALQRLMTSDWPVRPSEGR